jgi:hypothetical protein
LELAVNDADLFDQAVTDDGGRLDMATLPSAIAATLYHAVVRAQGFLRTAVMALPGLPPIHFDFIDNWGFNAKALRYDGRYFIGVYRGTVATLAVLFDRLLADPEILPFIEDTEAETSDLPLLPDIGIDFVQSVDSVPTFPRPRDSARRAAAQKLVELALDFLSAHEFAHLANGHLDYMTKAQGISAIDETGGQLPRAPIERELALINQAMEMDADATAVLISLISLSSEWRKVTGLFPRPGPEWDDIYSRPGMVSAQWAWAVLSLFRLLGDARLTVGDVTLEPYPRHRLRSVMVQRAAGQVPRPQLLAKHSALVGDEDHKIPMTIRAAQPQVEKMFSRLTGRPETTEGLDDAWGDAGESQMRNLQAYWQTKLRTELVKFAYQPLSSYGDCREGGL